MTRIAGHCMAGHGVLAADKLVRHMSTRPWGGIVGLIWAGLDTVTYEIVMHILSYQIFF